MSEAFPSLKAAPVNAEACSPEWISARAEIIARCGFVLRAGQGNTIEIRTQARQEHLSEGDRLKMNPWCVLTLPNEATAFASAEDRDAVLGKLTT